MFAGSGQYWYIWQWCCCVMWFSCGLHRHTKYVMMKSNHSLFPVSLKIWIVRMWTCFYCVLLNNVLSSIFHLRALMLLFFKIYMQQTGSQHCNAKIIISIHLPILKSFTYGLTSVTNRCLAYIPNQFLWVKQWARVLFSEFCFYFLSFIWRLYKWCRCCINVSAAEVIK